MAKRVVLELRVHGVRGTPPSTMLGVDADDVVQVAGNGITGVFRIAEGKNPPWRQLPKGMALEAYSWGGLTSSTKGLFGWLTRLLWLVLLPFALVNLAYWARLRVGEHNLTARVGLRLVRASGLLLTMCLISTVCVGAVDLFGWQCFRGNALQCPALPGPAQFALGWTAGERLAFFSLVPVAATGLLYLLSRSSISRFEEANLRLRDAGSRRPNDDSVLEHPLMWHGDRRTRRLQRLHVVVALATTVCFTGTFVIYSHWPHLGVWPTTALTGTVWTTAAAAVLLVFSFVVVARVHEDDVEYLSPAQGESPAGRRWWGALRQHAIDISLAAIVLVTVMHLVVLALLPAGTPGPDVYFWSRDLWLTGSFVLLLWLQLAVAYVERMPWWFTVTMLIIAAILGILVFLGAMRWPRHLSLWAPVIVGAMVLLGMFLANRHVSRRGLHRDHALDGAAASVFLSAGLAVALLFSAAAVIFLANYLNGSQGVADLAAGRDAVSAASAESVADFTAAGDVTIRGANVWETGSIVYVRSGTVMVRRLTASHGFDGLHEAFDTSTLHHASITISSRSIAVVDSCSARLTERGVDLPTPCNADNPRFTAGGDLAVTHRVLVIDSHSPGVTVRVQDPPEIPLIVPQVLIWTPMLQLAIVVATAIAFVVMHSIFFWRIGMKIRTATLQDKRLPAPDRSAVASARQTAALAHRAEAMVGALCVIMTVGSVLTLLGASTGRPPWKLVEPLRPLATVSLLAAMGAASLIVLFGSAYRRSPTARRNFGIIWDLTTFWPRAGHPFAPPCYAERVVPELERRVIWALRSSGSGDVILSGHSQGSLIVVATAARLVPRANWARRLRIITYGSQIRALYGRLFPRVVGPDQLGYTATKGCPTLGSAPELDDDGTWPSTKARVGHTSVGLRGRLQEGAWVNLVRRGDPIGFHVFSDKDSELDVVTTEVPRAVLGEPGPQVLTHGGYQNSPEYRQAVARWTREQVIRPSRRTSRVRPLPP